MEWFCLGGLVLIFLIAVSSSGYSISFSKSEMNDFLVSRGYKAEDFPREQFSVVFKQALMELLKKEESNG
jgi:hypothetical protein